MRVLFIEDDAMNRQVVRDMLAVVGLDMAEAESGEAGLAMIARNVYDIVLLDLRMPGMDGLTTIDRIRALPAVQGKVPIIVVTADSRTDLRETCLARGANRVLAKPVSMEALYEVLAEAAVVGETAIP